MQQFEIFGEGEKLNVSYPKLIAALKTLLSSSSGTTFPTSELQLGQSCYRSDLKKVYRLTQITPEIKWTLELDLSGDVAVVQNTVNTTGNQAIGGVKTFSSAVYGESFNGVYLRATATVANGTQRSLLIGQQSDGANRIILGLENDDSPVFWTYDAAGAYSGSVKIAAGKVTASGGFVGNVTGNVTGNVSGSSGSCTGNAATATKLVPGGTAGQILTSTGANSDPVWAAPPASPAAPVTKVFGRTGEVTLTAADVNTAMGYVPANPANVAPSTHSHNYAPMTAVVSIVKYEDTINRYIRYTRANGAVVDVKWANIAAGGGE